MLPRMILVGGLLALSALAGCLSDDPGDADGSMGPAGDAHDPHAHAQWGYHTYLGVTEDVHEGYWAAPDYRPVPETLTGFEPVAHVEGVSAGAGIAVFGSLAFAGPTGGPLHIVDISDPAAPEVLSVTDGIPVRDADTIAFPDGRLILVTTAGGQNIFVSDVTDPTDPVLVGDFTTPHSNHNIAVVPGTPIVYNSPSGGTATDIFDLSDPANPVEVQQWNNGAGCHDIAFYMDPVEEKYRGYCAGSDVIQIWDLADPKTPSIIHSEPFPGGGVQGAGSISLANWAHLAMVNHDASVLIVGDETGGGLLNGCDTYAETPAGTASGPLGNLWFFDLTDETAPVLGGSVSPEFYDDPADPSGSCTAHFGKVIEDTDHIAMSFYTSGVLLIDFTDLDNPVIKDRFVPDGADVWDVWYYQGYLFTGDLGRGMDVLTLA